VVNVLRRTGREDAEGHEYAGHRLAVATFVGLSRFDGLSPGRLSIRVDHHNVGVPIWEFGGVVLVWYFTDTLQSIFNRYGTFD